VDLEQLKARAERQLAMLERLRKHALHGALVLPASG
jgi:hypothetical protein